MDGAVLHDENKHVAELAPVLDQIVSDYLPGLSSEALGERCMMLLSARERIDALMATTVAEADRAGVPLLGKQRTMAQYLASYTLCS